jgi:ribose/xylose/arabinose/galactoside ABC-type transport system permease subunit
MTQTVEIESPISSARKLDWKSVLSKLGPFIGLAFVFALFAALKHKTFVTTLNIQIMLLQTTVVATGALGMTMIIISAGIDLSVGSVVALSTIIVAKMLNAGAWPIAAAAGGVAVGVASGFITGNLVVGQIGRVLTAVIAVAIAAWFYGLQWSGLLVIGCTAAVLILGIGANELFLKDRKFVRQLQLIPFIATLGMMGAVRGVAHWQGENGTIPVYAKSWLMNMLVILDKKNPLVFFGWNVTNAFPGLGANETWMLFPSGVWMMLILAAVTAFALRYTKFGRHVFAIGSNEQTARLCGINVERTKLLIYMIGVGFSGLAGVLMFSFLGMGDSTTAQGKELDIIAAVVIGGASLNGGEGSVLGSIVGALIMTVVANGCNQVELPNYWQEIVTGGIIIVAVLLDRLRHRESA